MDHPHSLRLHLREGTRDLHEALDESVRRQGYLRSREGFRDFLARSLAFQAAAEDLLDQAGIDTLIPDWPLRRRAHLLRADLAALSPRPESPVDERVVAGLLAGPGDAAHLLGIAYVLEGSVLGASVVRREIHRQGLADGRHISYLGSDGPPERRWKTFAELLASHEPTVDRNAALLSARSAFAAAHHCLAGGGESKPG